MKKSKTNVQRMKELVKAMAYDPILQMFIIERLYTVSKEVLDNKEEIRKEMQRHIIHPEAWIESAQIVFDIVKTEQDG